MKRYCRHCRTRLRLRQARCPYCRRSSVSWLHRAVIAAFAVTAAFFLLKAF
jgi:RNA polymerase subunit RPABC4/transcription elongation factor Spt4